MDGYKLGADECNPLTQKASQAVGMQQLPGDAPSLCK